MKKGRSKKLVLGNCFLKLANFGKMFHTGRRSGRRLLCSEASGPFQLPLPALVPTILPSVQI